MGPSGPALHTPAAGWLRVVHPAQHTVQLGAFFAELQPD